MKCFRTILLALLVICFSFPAGALAAGGKKDAKQKVFFKNLKDGQTITSPFKVEMGLEGMSVAAAGQVKDGEGHHHIIIDGKPMKAGQVIPADKNHLHFGTGQTETQLDLSPGEHTLTLQFADGLHRSYGKRMASSIKVKVSG